MHIPPLATALAWAALAFPPRLEGDGSPDPIQSMAGWKVIFGGTDGSPDLCQTQTYRLNRLGWEASCQDLEVPNQALQPAEQSRCGFEEFLCFLPFL